VTVNGDAHACGAVLVAAGPWTPEVVDPSGGWRPIAHVWGAVAEVRLPRPPRRVVEEAGVSRLALGGDATPSLFSLVTASGVSSVGSTFTAAPPDAESLAPELLRRGAAFVPALAGAQVVGTRACARPQSLDGRPLIGPVAGVGGLHVLAGHGPWGISLGPATARLAAAAILDPAAPPPTELAAGRGGTGAEVAGPSAPPTPAAAPAGRRGDGPHRRGGRPGAIRRRCRR